MVVKETRSAHFERCTNRLSFRQAFEIIKLKTQKEYYTAGNNTPFIAQATITTNGIHKGKKVIKFFTKGTEKGRAYECCWGHITNCNRTYIDCFTKVIE